MEGVRSTTRSGPTPMATAAANNKTKKVGIGLGGKRPAPLPEAVEGDGERDRADIRSLGSRNLKQKQQETIEEAVLSKKRKMPLAPSGQDLQKVTTVKRATTSKPAEKADGGEKADWTNEDTALLIEKLMQILPKDDVVKYNTQIEKVNWEMVKFGNHSAEDCKDKILGITAMQRRFRTLVELMEEAREWVKHPWMGLKRSKKGKHPDLPKKPLTPYFRYFLEKRTKYSQEFPDKSMTELAKLLAKKFAELPDKKKQKYKESYEKENETYKLLMQKFRKEHPDMYPEEQHGGRGAGKGPGKLVGPKKPQSSWQIFLGDKMKKHPTSSKKDLDKYRQQWKSLLESKKIKWIKKAMADEQRYAAELEQFLLENPDCKFSEFKSVINKTDKEIKARFDGKPEKPPNSGYSLYSKIMLKELKDIPSKEKMTEISRRWRELSDTEKDGYAKAVSEALEKYQKEYLQYLAGLPEDERKKLEDVPKKKRPTGSRAPGPISDPKDTSGSKPKKPLSAIFFYQQEKLAHYKLKYPNRSEQELTRIAARDFAELPEKKKEKYKKMAEEAKKLEDLSKARSADAKGKIFKGEPKKPPQSGYLLYTTEMITKMHDLAPNQRMGEISKRWKALSNAEREKYKKKAADVTRKYNRDMEKFLVGLSQEERSLYDQMKNDKKQAKGSKANVRKAKAGAAKEKSASEEEEEDDDEEEEDESDKEASSGSESGSESSSSGSEKSASGSGSGESESGSSDDEESDGTNKDATSRSGSEESGESESESASDE